MEWRLPRVEIYTKIFCGFCFRAKALLDSKKVDYKEYSVDAGGARRAEMIERSGGRTTVPQIFVNGRHIGGCDELMGIEQEGRLDDLLAAPPASSGQA